MSGASNRGSSPASKPTKKRRGARFAIEFRTQSTRTESGWTKWQHYIVAETQEDAERIVSTNWMRDWMQRDRGELRIVDRDVA